MCNKDRVAAFGSIKGIVGYLGKGDVVFLYHKGQGIVAAGEVRSDVKDDPGADAMYRELRWLTPKPKEGTAYKAMPAWQIKQVLDRNFYWATTMKTPYLSKDEVDSLLAALKVTLG